jgi:hypothetical protein
MDCRANRDTVRRRGVLDDLGMRAAWRRGDLGEGPVGRRARVVIEVEGRGREAGGAQRRRAPARRRLGARGAAWRAGAPEIIQTSPVQAQFAPKN